MKYILSTLLLLLSAIQVFGQSPYIYKVYEYRPAPGQFVNELPEYEAGDNANMMRLKAEECIAENRQILISLGGYGGFVVFGFDHAIRNIPGKYDFKILGNAFYANANPNPDAPSEGGSCEPGIVMVSTDVNGNGKPDDPWYELAGSEFYKSETIHNYELTYYRPSTDHVPTPDNNYQYLNDTTYIHWKSNQGTQGYVYRNIFHNQSYYPLWLNDDSLVFTGTKLANNYIDESGNGTYYVQYAYPWGYADNHPNNDDRSNFNIDWAVDSEGNSVNLNEIHFIKVYTGVNQYCGWLGETSTEIMGAIDLHALDVEKTGSPNTLKVLQNPFKQDITIQSSIPQTITIFSITGIKILTQQIAEGTTVIQFDNQTKGIYLIKSQTSTIKIIKL